MKWEKIPISKLAEITMGQSPSGKTYNHLGEGLPLLNGPTEFGTHYPYCTMYTTDSKRESKVGDLIFCVRGSTTGRMNWADQIYSLGRGVCSIRSENTLKTKYIKYCLDAFLDGLLQMAGGGTFPNLSKDDIGGFNIPHSDMDEKIAELLSTYDDLIENNLRRIKLLEECALMSYKLSVNSGKTFRVKLEEVVNVIKGRKPKDVSEIRQSDCVLYLLLDTVERSKDFFTSDLSIPMSKDDDVLMCMDGARSGLSFRGMKGAVGSTIAIWRANDERISGEYLYQFLKENESAITQGNTGAAIPHANRKFILEMKIPIITEDKMKEFSDLVEPKINLIRILYNQNSKLREARDILLPRLMSGEIEF